MESGFLCILCIFIVSNLTFIHHYVFLKKKKRPCAYCISASVSNLNRVIIACPASKHRVPRDSEHKRPHVSVAHMSSTHLTLVDASLTESWSDNHPITSYWLAEDQLIRQLSSNNFFFFFNNLNFIYVERQTPKINRQSVKSEWFTWYC